MVIADLAGSGQRLNMLRQNWRYWLSEPFVHFILAGIALFATYGLWGDGARDDRTITVTSEQIERLKAIWAAEAMRLPDDSDTAAIIADYVREEALYREAEKLRLGDDDTIIKRRLAQKMEFLLYDRTQIGAPSDNVLRSWFKAHQEQFRTPELRSFEHVYLNSEARGNAALSDAAAIKSQLEKGAEWEELGDPFMLKRTYADLSQRETARLFGVDFASAAYALPAGRWSKPVASAFGLHIVRIVAVSPPGEAQFEDNRDAIAAAWAEDQRRKANAAALQDLIAQYDVDIQR